MTHLGDPALRELLIEDAARGWRAFIDQYTPMMLATIEHSGLRNHDDVMEVYVRACAHLAEGGCARLRRHDPAKGPLRAWLVQVMRNVVVDWARSRRGRRRLFGSIQELDPLARRVFELFYWRRRTVAEIAEMARDEAGRPAGLAAVFEARERIEAALSARQRAELLSLLARDQTPAPLEDEEGVLSADPPDPAPGPDAALGGRETAALLDAALAELPREDALIVSLRYVEGLSTSEVQRALRLERLTPDRLRAILARLRGLLERRGLTPGEAADPARAVPGEPS
jgi:DNA-directed RNA polymerase specialized sigma24 family protein